MYMGLENTHLSQLRYLFYKTPEKNPINYNYIHKVCKAKSRFYVPEEVLSVIQMSTNGDHTDANDTISQTTLRVTFLRKCRVKKSMSEM